MAISNHIKCEDFYNFEFFRVFLSQMNSLTCFTLNNDLFINYLFAFFNRAALKWRKTGVFEHFSGRSSLVNVIIFYKILLNLQCMYNGNVWDMLLEEKNSLWDSWWKWFQKIYKKTYFLRVFLNLCTSLHLHWRE